MSKKRDPIIYSCSGCSSAAQMANSIAIALDRNKIGEMSCIAGVGGDVQPLVNVAKSGRPIVGLDGCPLQCVAHCLKRHELKPDLHFVLSDFGVKKVNHLDFDAAEAKDLAEVIGSEILTQFKKEPTK